MRTISEAWIIDAVRTPIGRYGGALSAVRPDDLAATAIGAAVRRAGVDPQQIDEVYFGATNGAGEDNRNVARMASLLAGLPHSVPGATLNRLCASGMEAVSSATRAIKVGEADLVLAGGVESMTRAPWVMLKPDRANPRGDQVLVDTVIGWRFVNPRMPALASIENMGETAENVAERYGVSREDQDRFAYDSHRRAVEASQALRFDQEVEPVSVALKRGETAVVSEDEGPRPDVSLDALSGLRPAFREGGSVTAGNSSSINDGAACLVLGSERVARAGSIAPLARVVASASAGVDPAIMGMGPVPAVEKVLRLAGLVIGDMDLIELNEAFASQSLACMRELDLEPEKVNVNGGAIALGHPLGCSGARIMSTLCWELRRRGLRYGLATMCVGVGQGMAVVVENPGR